MKKGFYTVQKSPFQGFTAWMVSLDIQYETDGMRFKKV